MNVNDVVTAMTLSGEYVGALVENNGNNIVLKSPKLVTSGENGLALADGISATGDVSELVHFHHVSFITPSHADVVSAYHAAIEQN
jgi:hypothetical protein